MYEIKVDGQVIWSPAFSDAAYQIQSPHLKCAFNKADSFSFVMPPTHAMRNALKKMKSIITIAQDGDEIFRGRAFETDSDIYNQDNISCEGELSFLLDSLVRPYDFDGSAPEFFRLMIEKHNEQVEEEKQFSVGNITAVMDENIFNTESGDYKDTLNEIRSILINKYGGYLRVRRENGILYLDYLKEYNEKSNQKIEFGVNLLDINKHINAQEFFTVLVPLSDIEDSNETLTIEQVNNGLDYIENVKGIEEYGRIVKQYVWYNITDPTELLKLASEKLQNTSTLDTLTIKAVDLHLLNAKIDTIRLGDTVHILSAPHGMDKEMICSEVDIDLFNPENTTYTFGHPEETVSNSVASSSRRSNENSNHIKQTENSVNIFIKKTDENTQRISMAELNIDGLKAEIELKVALEEFREYQNEATGNFEELYKYTSDLSIELDAAEAEIALKANSSEMYEKFSEQSDRIGNAEILINANKAAIALKADQELTDGLDKRLTAAEVDIDANAAAILLKADITEMDGLETRLSTAEADIDAANAAIKLKAETSAVTALGNRVTTAEADIDAANAAIALKVNKDGVIGAINVTPEEVVISASKINLSGYVTASKLSSELASINSQISTSISTSSISAANAAFTNIEFGGAALRLRTQDFVTAVVMPTWSTDYITYMDENMDVVQQRVVTGIYHGSVTTESLVYCGTN